MGIILGQLNGNFNLTTKSNYLDNLEVHTLLSQLFQLYENMQELKEEIASITASEKRCIADRNTVIKLQSEMYNRIKEMLDMKIDSYNIGNTKKDPHLENEINSLLRRCSSGDLKINQCNHELRWIPKRRTIAENNIADVAAEIEKTLKLIQKECQRFNFSKTKDTSLLKQECINYFSCIENVSIRAKMIELVLKNYELEKRVYHYIYDTANKTIKNSSFKISKSFDKNLSFMLKFNNKIYEYILNFVDLQNLDKYKENDIKKLLAILSSLINELSEMFKIMLDNGNYGKNIDHIFELKDIETLNGKTILKKYHLTFLNKKEINFYIVMQQKFDEMINLVETFFGKREVSIPNVKRKGYYNK